MKKADFLSVKMTMLRYCWDFAQLTKKVFLEDMLQNKSLMNYYSELENMHSTAETLLSNAESALKNAL